MGTKEKFMLLIVSFLFMSVSMTAQEHRMTQKKTTENENTEDIVIQCTKKCYYYRWENYDTELHVIRGCKHDIFSDAIITIEYYNGSQDTKKLRWKAEKQRENQTAVIPCNKNISGMVDVDILKPKKEDVKLCPNCHKKPSTITVRWKICTNHSKTGCLVCKGHLGWPTPDPRVTDENQVYYCRNCAKYYFTDDMSEIVPTKIDRLPNKQNNIKKEHEK